MQQAYYLTIPNILNMHKSICLVLVIGVAIVMGVFVFADSVNSSVNGGENVNSTIKTVNNSSVKVEVLVRFNPDLWNTTALQYAVRASHAYIGATVKMDYEELGLTGLQLVLLPVGMTANEGISYYESLPYVLYAEPNAVYSIESTGNESPVNNTKASKQGTGNVTNITPARLLVQLNVSDFSDLKNMSVFANQTHGSLNATVVKDYTPEGLSGLQLVELPKNMTPEKGIGFYKNISSVLFVEPDYLVTIQDPQKK